VNLKFITISGGFISIRNFYSGGEAQLWRLHCWLFTQKTSQLLVLFCLIYKTTLMLLARHRLAAATPRGARGLAEIRNPRSGPTLKPTPIRPHPDFVPAELPPRFRDPDALPTPSNWVAGGQ
jgi:hypothetical protein